MNANRFSRLAVAAVAGLALTSSVAAADADAALYCVNQGGTPCPVGTIAKGADLQAALTAAAATPEADTVTVGPGTYAKPSGDAFNANSPSPLTVKGSGPSTVLTGTKTAVLYGGASTVRSLTIDVPDVFQAAGAIGNDGAVFEDLTVVGGANTMATGVSLQGGATLRKSTVELAEAGNQGVSMTVGAQAPVVEDTTIDAFTGVRVGLSQPGPAAIVRRVTVEDAMQGDRKSVV